MKKIFLVVIVLAAALGSVALWKAPQFGVVSSITSSDTQNTERATVNDLITLARNFSTTTNNTFTGTNTFTGSLVISGSCTGCGTAPWPWTVDQYNSVTVNSTTTPLWLKNTSVIASTTNFTYASTTQLTVTGSGTSTRITGNTVITGNLQVDGVFYAPVQIVSSGNATINGTLTVTGQTTLATSLTGFVTAASGVISATAAGGTNHVLYSTAANTPASEAALTYLASGDLLTMVNASTTNLTASQSLYAADSAAVSRRVTGVHGLSFTLSTSTLWTGTSSAVTAFGDGGTIYAPFAGAMQSLQCGTNAGGLTVQVTSGGSSIYVVASTTAGLNPKTLSFTKGAAITIVGGNRTGSPTSTPCTIIAQEN